jgi:hypothetical protein
MVDQKIRAHSFVAQAVKSGKLVRPARCSACGRVTKARAHHSDYSRPLAVVWLCPKCHKAVHRGEASTAKKKVESKGPLRERFTEPLMLHLPPSLLATLRKSASTSGESIGAFVRALLRRECGA